MGKMLPGLDSNGLQSPHASVQHLYGPDISNTKVCLIKWLVGVKQQTDFCFMDFNSLNQKEVAPVHLKICFLPRRV